LNGNPLQHLIQKEERVAEKKKERKEPNDQEVAAFFKATKELLRLAGHDDVIFPGHRVFRAHNGNIWLHEGGGGLWRAMLTFRVDGNIDWWRRDIGSKSHLQLLKSLQAAICGHIERLRSRSS
jgi:hypothetical protein